MGFLHRFFINEMIIDLRKENDLQLIYRAGCRRCSHDQIQFDTIKMQQCNKSLTNNVNMTFKH